MCRDISVLIAYEIYFDNQLNGHFLSCSKYRLQWLVGSCVAIQVQGSQFMAFSSTHPTAQSRGVIVQPLTGVQCSNAQEVK